MNAVKFDALSRTLALDTSRRQLGRLLAGSVLAAAGLVRVSTDVTARRRPCCRTQRRRFRRVKRICESLGGQIVEEFSCDQATCNRNEQIEYTCAAVNP